MVLHNIHEIALVVLYQVFLCLIPIMLLIIQLDRVNDHLLVFVVQVETSKPLVRMHEVLHGLDR